MNYLIIGASAAGINAARTLRQLDKFANITILSRDKQVYSRSMLHLYISGERKVEELNFIPENFFIENDIKWLGGKEVIGVNTYSNTVSYFDIESEKNREPHKTRQVYHKRYNKLLIATGAATVIPHNIRNLENAKNVFRLRNIEDAKEIKSAIKKFKSVSIIGGGLVGIYLASQLIESGMDIDIVEYGNNILALQLDKESAMPYQNKLKEAGVKIHTNCVAKSAIVKDDLFKGLTLSNGEKIKSDMVIISAGIRPNTEFLDDSEILTDMGVVELKGTLLREGVVVNKNCRTNIEDVYAAGDVCAERIGIWPLAVKEGINAAHHMAGLDYKQKNTFGLRNSMSFFGINTISLGDPNLTGEGYIQETYSRDGVYKKIIHKDGIIHTAILQGDIEGAGVYEKLIGDGIDISHLNKSVFDINYGDFYNIDEAGEFYYE